MIQAAEELGKKLGVRAACRALSLPRGYLYRSRKPAGRVEKHSRERSARALSTQEREQVHQTLNSERFQNDAPREVYARLLDDGRYLCSWRTMYRVLEEHQETQERRNQLRLPKYKKPELLATGPNQLWSWDITRLKGPTKWTYFYLYVVLDVYSRYVVGWMIAVQEAAHLAEQLITEICQRQGIQPGQLTIHADRGVPMTSKTVALLLSDLGITKTHSRPHVSNDNPYSEAQFKTMKYRPDYPQRFGCLLDARTWANAFFRWYNHEHYHSGISLITPADVHYDRAAEVIRQRQAILQTAFAAHPERFVQGLPIHPGLPDAVWINPPKEVASDLPTNL